MSESHRITGTDPCGPPSRSTALTLTDPELGPDRDRATALFDALEATSQRTISCTEKFTAPVRDHAPLLYASW
jgi:hypothetical protein